nr:MAG TPA: hypothetical protein [Bacteriophage sp.]
MVRKGRPTKGLLQQSDGDLTALTAELQEQRWEDRTKTTVFRATGTAEGAYKIH